MLETQKEELLSVADSLAFCSDEELRKLGYRSMMFLRHNYLYVYRVEDDKIS